VRKTISKYNMLKPTDTIAVAVSGGKDSISLLYILNKIEQKFSNSKIFAITIDEGIPKYRDEAIKIASKHCKILNIRHLIVSFEEIYGYKMDEIAKIIRKKKSLSACTYCGVLRRKILNKVARKAGADVLATAHTLDDEVQTLLLNIIRGDVQRLNQNEHFSGANIFVKRIKPFQEILEKETAFYAFLQGFKFQTITCPYTYSSSRNEVRDFLNRIETKYAGTKFAIFKSFERMKASLKQLSESTNIGICKICGEPAVGDKCRVCQILHELNLPLPR
jgi:uncharacterized protein (TIGR00269 family)